jgi:general secretion pathway protein D
MTTTADNVYKTIGKLGGINVLFDLDYKPQKITIELNEVTLEDALKMVAMESKTFWRPISSTAIFVAAEGKRKELESNVMKTFYLQNTSSTADLQEVVGTLKGMLDITRIQTNVTHSSITMRATPDQMVLAEKLISDFDKPKSEVIIDIAVLEVNRDHILNLGTTMETSTTISPATVAGTAAGGGLIKVGSVLGNTFTTTLPSATLTYLLSDSDTKVIQRPSIRALNDEKATLNIGERVPIATGSFTAGSVGSAAGVNTQFQYLDVGVNIDITPHIHSQNEVTLKMSLEISSIAGSETIGGITQPTIGQRRIQHETRLRDGEVNLVGGILDDTETHSLSGYPWLAKIPLLGYLFGQQNRQHTQNEVVFAITPHIVRADEFTDENLRLVDVGTGTIIGLRYKQPIKTEPTEPPAGPETPASPNRRNQPSGAAPRPPAPGAGPNP